MSTVAPLFHAAPPKRMGRPRGARAAIVASSRALGIHHFSFLRATLVGVDARAAFARYLEWGETNADLRHIQHRRSELFKDVLDAGRRLDTVRPPEAKLTRHLELLRSSLEPSAMVELPTLDAWMQSEGLDPDAWSEADAIAEYRGALGIDNLEAIDAAEGLKDATRDRVAALNYLQTLLAVSPQAADAIDAWFARPVVLRLRNAGVVTLENLATLINVGGHRWHMQVKGFGARRAVRVVAWLRSQAESLQLDIRASVDEPRSAGLLRRGADAAQLVTSPRFGLVPFEHLALPSALRGTDGLFKSHMPNTLEASDDLQAIGAWLSRYRERASTARSYRKEIERFVLWCALENGKPASSSSALDCQAFRSFLQAVPDAWIHPAPVARSDPTWRPFRGQPSPASQKQALVIVQTMFEGLRDAGYLVANPMRAVMKGFKLPTSKLDLKRSFTEAEWGHVLRCVAETPAGAEQLRLRCVLELLVSSGIRLDELAKAQRADLRIESLAGLPDSWVLSVVGKRDKRRDVPVADDIVALLDAHALHFADDDAGVVYWGSLPLIRGLSASVPQWGRSSEGAVMHCALTEKGGAALSAAGIYAVVKRFFGRVATTATAAELDPVRFERASTHWMRHTFVRQALVDGAPIEVVSELAGHASIATTSIYSSQELARKIKAVQAMKRRTAPAGAGR